MDTSSTALIYKPTALDQAGNVAEQKFHEILATFNIGWIELEYDWLNLLYNEDESKMTQEDKNMCSFLRQDIDAWKQLFQLNPTHNNMCQHMYKVMTARADDILKWNINELKSGSKHGDLLVSLCGDERMDFWYLLSIMDEEATAITRDSMTKLFKIAVIRGIYDSEPFINDLLCSVFRQVGDDMSPTTIVNAVMKQLMTSSLLQSKVERIMKKKKSYQTIFAKMLLVLQIFLNNNNNTNNNNNNTNHTDQKENKTSASDAAAGGTVNIKDVIQSQLTDDKMTQSLELAKKQVESAIKKILQEEKVDLEHVTEDQFQLLIACLNDCEPIEAKDQKQNDDAQKSKDERFQQLMEQKWLTHEQWVKLSELYVENEWYEMSAEKVLPKLRGTMDKFLHAVHQNDTDAWKSILKETVDVDITDEFDPQSDIDEEDDDDDE
jgi:hypothetical protein